MNTLFEKLLLAMLSHRSANVILFYIENKGWFTQYRQRHLRTEALYSIPYEEWRELTLINLQHIKILNEFIWNDEGSIEVHVVNGKNMVMIWSSQLHPYKSKEPRKWIYSICKHKKSAKHLANYLDEFYKNDFRDYSVEDSKTRYCIDYEYWYDYFQLSTQHIDELNAYFQNGVIRVLYDKHLPVFVEIRE
jgi:hypothetical protein